MRKWKVFVPRTVKVFFPLMISAGIGILADVGCVWNIAVVLKNMGFESYKVSSCFVVYS